MLKSAGQVGFGLVVGVDRERDRIAGDDLQAETFERIAGHEQVDPAGFSSLPGMFPGRRAVPRYPP